MQVGFIGLGRMGSAMAANLLAAGHALTVYNRTAAKAEPLVSQGAHLAKMPGDAARGEVAITMLADDPAVEDAVLGRDGILTALAPGAIRVSMSTISVALAERLEVAHREKGQEFVAAPVFGRPEAASAAKLFIVAAGPRQAVAIASVIESSSEAFALVSKAGVDRTQYLDILTNTLFGAPVYKTYGAFIAEERYQPAGFKAELSYKDVRLALSAARGLEVPMPLASFISDRFLALLAARGSDLDWSALALIAKRDAVGETLIGPSE
jgi:3-hydroxyisobutyrate dehydrogenase-like beta-hydroxyacid dehydrogenase